QVPPSPQPRDTAFGEIYDRLARLYEARSHGLTVRALLPGPLDARHPGFELTYEPTARIVAVRERAAAPRRAPRALRVQLSPDDPRRPLAFLDGAFAELGALDAWELFALREMLRLLRARTDPAAQRLESDLARPRWDLVLEYLVPASRGRD